MATSRSTNRQTNPPIAEGSSPQTQELRSIVRTLSDPREQARLTTERTLDALRRNFQPITSTNPRTGRQRVLELVGDLEVDPIPDPYDYGAVKDTLTARGTYGPRVFGTFRITERDKDGNVLETIQEKRVPLARIPTPTFDRSFIVDGKKHYLANQFRRKPGAFNRVNQAGEYISEFNLDPFTEGRVNSFKVVFDQGDATSDRPADFRIEYKGPTKSSKTIPGYDVYRLLGGDERKLKREVGDDIAGPLLQSATDERYAQSVSRLYEMVLAKPPLENLGEMETELRSQFNLTRMDPKLTKSTLGVRADRVDDSALVSSFSKLVSLANESIDPDDRETLAAKKIMAPHDLLAESVGHQKEVANFRREVEGKLRSPTPDLDLILRSRLNRKLLSRLRASSVDRADDSTTPIGTLTAATSTTIMGEGAIGSENAVPLDAKLVNGSHLSFLDPAFTPDSSKAGVSLHTTVKTRIVDDKSTHTAVDTGSSKLVTEMLTQDGTKVDLSPDELQDKVIGAFDQMRLRNGKPVPKGDGHVKAFRNGQVVEVKAGDVDYWMPDQTSMYSVSSSLIPFVNSVQGNRVQYSDKQTKQSVPLVNREAPLIQVKAPGSDKSMEELLGEEMGAVRSTVTGTVTRIRDTKSGRYVDVETSEGEKTIPLPKDLPMGGHTPLTSEVRVKVGDQVKPGDLIADSNFTKDGTMAYGVNLRTAYVPYKTLSVSGGTYVFWVDEEGGHFDMIRNMPASGGTLSTALDTKSLQPQLLRVHSYIGHYTDERMYEIRTMDGVRVRATAFHSFITVDEKGDFIEVAPEEMVPNKTLLPFTVPQIPWAASPGRLHCTGDRKTARDFELVLNRDAGWLFGMYVAEGSIIYKNGMSRGVCFAASEPELRDKLEQLLSEMGIAPQMMERSVVASNAPLARLFHDTCGRYAQHKRVPDLLWSGTKDFAEGFIDGYWCGDGTVSGKQLTASTTSPRLAEGVTFLLAALGIKARYTTYPVPKNGNFAPNQIHIFRDKIENFPRLTLSRKREGIERLKQVPVKFSRDRIPLPGELRSAVHAAQRKAGIAIRRGSSYDTRDRLRQVYDELPVVLQRLVDAPIWWEPVTEVVEVEKEDYVYDLDMRPLENFMVGPGLIVHNTFEDAFLISDSGAKKMTSEHLYDESRGGRGTTFGLKQYAAHGPKLKEEEYSTLDDDGIIKPGTIVKPGQALMVGLTGAEVDDKYVKAAARLGVFSKSDKNKLDKTTDPFIHTWNGHVDGEVVDVKVTRTRQVGPDGRARNVVSDAKVLVKTQEPFQAGDKAYGRHGNKGVASRVVPDDEMPVIKGRFLVTDPGGSDLKVGQEVTQKQLDDLQTRYPKLATKPAHVEVMLNPLCYDSETEVLTAAGWKRFPDVQKGDLVASLTPEHELVFEAVTETHRSQYVGPMYRIQNKKVNLLVTPGHRMYTKKASKVEHPYEVRPAMELFGKRRNYLKSAKSWAGSTPAVFRFAEDNARDGRKGPPLDPGRVQVDPILFAKFLGFFISEGWLSCNPTSYAYTINVCQSAKANHHKVREIEEVMSQLPWATTLSFKEDGEMVVWSSGHRELFLWLEEHVGTGSHNKRIPREVLFWGRDALKALLDALLLGDGSRRSREGQRDTWRYFTTSPGLADDVQELLLRLGLAANIKEDKRDGSLVVYVTEHIEPVVNWPADNLKAFQVEQYEHYDGEVHCLTVPSGLLFVRREGCPIWSGNSVPGRINPSQNFETFLGKLAAMKGTPEKVENFSYDSNWDFVKKRLDEEGISDADDLLDPVTGRTIKSVGTGTQYFLKAKQTVSSKNQARGIGRWDKRTGLALKGDDGALALGELGTYGLLAQNAREFLRDAQINKSEANPVVWEAVRSGRPIPANPLPDKETESLTRLFNYMRAAGIQTVHDEDSSTYRMRPLTDRDVEEMTRTFVSANQPPVERVLTEPYEIVRAKDLRPAPGGLFDPALTGGPLGGNWSRFELTQRIPNPVYEKAIIDLLGLKKKQFNDIMRGAQAVTIDGETHHGSKAIETLLSKLDLKTRMAEASEVASSHSKASERSRAHRVMRSIRMMEENKMTPTDAFMRKQVAVAPPMLRGIDLDNKNVLQLGDLNYLYRDVALTNEELKGAYRRDLPPRAVGDLESGLYETMKTLMQVEGSKPMSDSYRGVLGTLIGKTPTGEGNAKNSLFKDSVFQRRQSFSARAVLGPDDDLGLDEMGLPRQVAAKIGELHIERAWKQEHPNASTEQSRAFRERLKAYGELGKTDEEVDRYMEKAFSDRYLVLKRDPVLHKYGVQGFKPVLTHRSTMSMNPLVYSGFNADHDGDQLAIFLPLSEEANTEVKEKLLPTKNLFNPASGSLEFTLGHEAVLGLSRLSRMPPGKDVKASFESIDQMKKAYNSLEVDVKDTVEVAGEKTTVGRALLDDALPPGVNLGSLRKQGLISEKSLENGLSSRDLRKVLEHVAINHTPTFGESANALRALGQNQATYTGASLILDDLKPLLTKERREADREMRAEIRKIRNTPSFLMSEEEKKERIEKVFHQNLDRFDQEASKLWRSTFSTDRPNSTAEMMFSGARAKPEQLAQLSVAPVGLIDGRDNIVEVPVMRNYSEGLDAAGIWASMHGARKGAVSKVIQVRDPGYLTKLVVNTTIDQVVTEEDCGTNEGVPINVGRHAENDLVGRVLTSRLEGEGLNLSEGKTLSPDDVYVLKDRMKEATVMVRSPLTCKAKSGLCQRCAGADKTGQFLPIGENMGVHAATALGERSTQLALSTFHGGGRVSKGGTARDLYQEAQYLLRMPASSVGVKRAVVAPDDVEVDKVKDNRAKGGWDVITKGDDKPNIFIPRKFRPPEEVRRGDNGPKTIPDFLKPGTVFKRGDVITDGMANPKDILQTTGSMPKTQNYMVSKLDELFSKEGVSRRNVETVVRSMTNTVEITSPGESTVFPGTRMSLHDAQELQRDYPGVKFSPILRGVDVAPREMREDFLARLNFNHLRTAITESAQIGARTDYHSVNPIPALAVGREFGRPPSDRPGAY